MSNNTGVSDNDPKDVPASGIAYGTGFALGVFLLITTITVVSYFCARASTTTRRQLPQSDHPINRLVVVGGGLDDATLRSYPTLTYSEATLPRDSDIPNRCAICLADYNDSDVLRLLPDCGHLFHLNCLDRWLKQHPTCPICRTSPPPYSMPTSSAVAVPLAQVV
ncbi:RING-H2 finger protein ATL70-like [Nymphaea colorata]|nr:RING-H2 finger protein ATL70-like [Nymphaea colorata]